MMHWWENVRLCIGSAKTTYTRGRGVGVWRLVVWEWAPGAIFTGLIRASMQELVGDSLLARANMGLKCTDNAVRIHSSRLSLLARSWSAG
jgi:hypothetical protein